METGYSPVDYPMKSVLAVPVALLSFPVFPLLLSLILCFVLYFSRCSWKSVSASKLLSSKEIETMKSKGAANYSNEALEPVEERLVLPCIVLGLRYAFK
ncbi:hypothetical protein I3843_09G204600 [Carya illinoinensis]|nr:hypothetical protein I3843_09G204600 [Carya illinoinensis]